MIIVHRLTGQPLGVNADLVERIESMPDTVLTLADGKKILVKESLEEVIDLVVAYQASVLRISYLPHYPATEPTLRLISSENQHDAAESDRPSEERN